MTSLVFQLAPIQILSFKTAKTRSGVQKSHFTVLINEQTNYSEPCHFFSDRLSLNAGQKYCRMLLQHFRPSLSHNLSLGLCFAYFEWTLKTGFVLLYINLTLCRPTSNDSGVHVYLNMFRRLHLQTLKKIHRHLIKSKWPEIAAITDCRPVHGIRLNSCTCVLKPLTGKNCLCRTCFIHVDWYKITYKLSVVAQLVFKALVLRAKGC